MKVTATILLASLTAMIFSFGCSGCKQDQDADDGRYIVLDVGRGATMKLVLVPAGTFMMGSEKTEAKRGTDEGPRRRVTITRDFYMSVHEITQRQHEAVMGTNPSRYRGLENPVEMTSWDDAQAFCRELSRMTKMTVKLPTEAQWEYACRAGTTTPFNTGDTIGADGANYDGRQTYGGGDPGEYRHKTTPVGSFKPNAFGLYDMHGNVWEWCGDWYGAYPPGDATDPTGPRTGTGRILRGGSWRHGPRGCRSANRDICRPDRRDGRHGFRVIVYPSGSEPSATTMPN